MYQVQGCRTNWRILISVHILLYLPPDYGQVLLRHDKLNVRNLTATSATIVWSVYFEMSTMEQDSRHFHLTISHQRDGYSPNYIVSDLDDPVCSLRISKCILTNLVPDTVYRVRVTVDYRRDSNNTVIDHADIAFSTLPTLSAEGDAPDVERLMMVVVGPAVAGVGIILITAVVCRVCRCCCWRKTNPGVNTATSIRHVLRSESHATRQWVKDTFIGIDPSPTYDQPLTSPTTSIFDDKQHCYLQVSKKQNRRTPLESKKSKQRIHNSVKPVPSTPPPTALPPSAPTAYINTASKHRTPPATDSSQSQGSKGALLHQHPGHERAAQHSQKQEAEKAVTYTNTEDLSKLLGNARKMFPML